MKLRKALITAGGKGTRLRPITYVHNKHLIPLVNKPMLQYAIEYVASAGIKEIGIITNPEYEDLEKAFGNGKMFGVRLTYIPQEAPLGLAHAVITGESFLRGEPFVFYLGDNILRGGIQQFLNAFHENKSDCHLVLSKVRDPQRFGVPQIVDKRIISIEEKPEKPKSDYAVTGIYLYNESIYEAVHAIQPSPRGELEISDAHQYLIEHKREVTYSEITGWWKDTGKPEDLLEANRMLLQDVQNQHLGYSDDKSVLAGQVFLSEGSVVENSIVRGPVHIGKNCRILNSYLGPYTCIGNGCEILNSEIEYSILMDDAAIRDVDIRIEGSILGKSAVIRKTEGIPANHRFIIGDRSQVQIR
ncbi:MAG: glucose-phosphate thymidylyltransferase [Candidatus Marinimicrobia bacterium]|nr:glucose-phosphate thymidylyltransferase [Candidatus Neomarinimicrobiota bacterium]